MVVSERVSEQTYRRIALEEPDRHWELHRGRLREKPPTSVEHNWLAFYLGHLLQSQLDPNEFRLRVNAPRLRRSAANYYLPDVAVIPAALERTLRQHPGSLDAYADPLPLVVEIWSPSTGDYDVNEKLDEYQRRGDLEIWRLHPFERTLTIWQRQPDGTYVETILRDQVVRPAFLPGVAIDLSVLFEA